MNCWVSRVRGLSCQMIGLALLCASICVSGNAASAAEFSGQKAGQLRDDNPFKLKFCWCPPGSFRMGSPSTEADREQQEAPVDVTFKHGFWLCQVELTQQAWESVMRSTPWNGEKYVQTGPHFPATNIHWEEIVEFCRKLTKQERTAGRLPPDWEYTLPTEAQWEYACRAGSTGRFTCGDSAETLGNYAWYGGIVGTGTAAAEKYAHPGALKRPNAWGLCDMHGNLWEWCLDLKTAPLPGGNDPLVIAPGRTGHVIRGGSWRDAPNRLRSAYRYGVSINHRKYYLGCRLAIAPVNSTLKTLVNPAPTRPPVNKK